MAITTLLLIGTIIAGILAVPYIASNLSDLKPTGRMLLNLNDTDIDKIPTKSQKIFTSDKFERTYETAFGKVSFRVSSDKIIQELYKPDRTVICTETPQEVECKLITKEYSIDISQTSSKIIEKCTTPDGTLEKTKENGEIEETFTGLNSDTVLSTCSNAKSELQREMDIMMQIREETIIPGFENNKTNTTESASIKITDIDEKQEWIEIENDGESIDLEGWRISDLGNHIYEFGQFTLNSGAKVKIYSGDAYMSCSEDNETLCWTGSKIWNDSGDTATLKDPDGIVIDTYSY